MLPRTTVPGDEGVGVTEEQHYHDQWSAQESSIAANPYVAAILANMPTALSWQSEDTLTDQDVVRSQHSHKLHKEMELIAESVRQTRLDNSRTGMHVCVCVRVYMCAGVRVCVCVHVQDTLVLLIFQMEVLM